MDVHKETTTYAVFEDGDFKGTDTIPSKPSVMQSLARSKRGAIFIMEACGIHEWIHDILDDEDADVRVFVAPRREAKQRKSDVNDAVLLARRFLSSELRQVFVAPKNIRDLRQIVEDRAFLVKVRTMHINRLKSLLNMTGVHARHGSHNLRKRKEELAQIVPSSRMMQDMIKILDGQIKTFDKTIMAEGAKIPVVTRLRSIRGFGKLVALAFYVKVWDVRRFPNADALVSYLGSDPVWESSGDKHRDTHKTSRTCSNLLRSYLNQASWVHVNAPSTSNISQDYQAKSRSLGKGRAIGRVQRKLIKAAYHVWKDDRDFTMTRPASLVSCRAQAAT